MEILPKPKNFTMLLLRNLLKKWKDKNKNDEDDEETEADGLGFEASDQKNGEKWGVRKSLFRKKISENL